LHLFLNTYFIYNSIGHFSSFNCFVVSHVLKEWLQTQGT
jgi:hypothetical protein